MMSKFFNVNKRKSNQNILVQHVINFMNKNRRKSSSTAFQKVDHSEMNQCPQQIKNDSDK